MDDDILFGVMRDGKITQQRTIRNWSVRNCPHLMLVADHYNEDGTCRCRDSSDPNMPKYGYVWSEREHRWVAP